MTLLLLLTELEVVWDDPFWKTEQISLTVLLLSRDMWCACLKEKKLWRLGKKVVLDYFDDNENLSSIHN